ncbi:Glu-tRNA(Gln) amidotransferase subunit GatD [Candidatus Pacearchaeota archaeon]|nr:Glu-tRNA(Gln) amidotransferase subunit GatD [Candidatus Pacearchaeota archaeon]
MVEIKELTVGDKVSLRTAEKTWEGNVLESYDSEIVLIKLSSGYNIGIREREVLDVKVLEKSKETEKKKVSIEPNKKLPNVAMIITGGTISSRLDPKSGAVISTDADEILNMAPEIKEICNISKIEKPFMKWSENMCYKDWKKLAETCETLLNDNSISGVIITHGTDFLHYSAEALSFMLGKLNKPVALTYSQRSIDRGSTDASLNLICAAKYAVSDIAEVALVGHKNLDDEYCLAMPGTKVRKMHTSKRDAFQIINSEPFAEISKTGFKILRGFNARDNSRKIKADLKFESKVASIKITPGQDPKILDFLASEGYKGIILELTGLGHVPAQDADHNWLPTIKKTTEKGIIICGTAQTVYGGLNGNVYSAGRDLQKTGLIYLADMLSETAFVKLGWVLGHPTWLKEKKVESKMLENISGEFNNKLSS